jgi:hypothetical protein
VVGIFGRLEFLQGKNGLHQLILSISKPLFSKIASLLVESFPWFFPSLTFSMDLDSTGL